MLLERERELGLLSALLERACAGRGAIVWIEGETGIGKTALLRSLRAMAAASMRVFSACGAALEVGYAFGVARQLFGPLGSAEELRLQGAARLAVPVLWPAADRGLAPEPSFAALHGLYWLVAHLAAERPLLLAVDDADLADQASLRFLCFLGRRVGELAVVLAASGRPRRDRCETGALAELRRLAAGAEGSVMRLAPLSRLAVARLLAAEIGRPPDQETVAVCHAASAGLPLHVHELARELKVRDPGLPGDRDGAPPAAIHPRLISEIVAKRLERCSPAAVALARALSVLGQRPGAWLACELAELGPADLSAAIRELRAVGVLDSHPALSFQHPSIGEALLQELAPAETERMHARAAALLRAAGSDPELVAAHLLRAGPDPSGGSAELLLELAERALRAGASAEARRYLEHALAGLPPRRLLGRLRLALGSALLAAGDPRAAIPELDRAARAQGSWHVRLQAAQLAAEARAACGRELEGLDLLAALIERAGAADPAALSACKAYLAAAGRGLEATAQRSIKLIEELRSELYRSGAEPAVLGVIAWDDAWRNRPAAEVARLALRAVEPGREAAHASLYFPAINAFIYAERLADAERVIARLHTAAVEQGAPVAAAIADCWEGYVRLRRGDLRGARTLAQRAHAALGELGMRLTQYLSLPLLILTALAGGELQEAEMLLSLASERDRDRDPGWSAQAVEEAARAELLLELGDAGRALRAAFAAAARVRRLRIACPNFASWRAVAALAAHALGDRAQAAALAEAELAAARRFGAPRSLGIALRVRALVAPGGVEVEGLRRSVEVLRSSEDRLELARSLAELGSAMRRAGARQQAREPLSEALELAVRCGADGLRARLRSELAAAGARPRREVRTGVEALTPSERRVCELAAGGRSNTSIAQSLFVSRRTVESQLRSAYRKLGINSRAQLLDALLAGEQADVGVGAGAAAELVRQT